MGECSRLTECWYIPYTQYICIWTKNDATYNTNISTSSYSFYSHTESSDPELVKIISVLMYFIVVPQIIVTCVAFSLLRGAAVLKRLASDAVLNFLRAIENLWTTKENISEERRSSFCIATQKVLVKKIASFCSWTECPLNNGYGGMHYLGFTGTEISWVCL
jgi:hypothetical protein